MTKTPRSNTSTSASRSRVGRPLKSTRQLSVTSNKIIDRALELMVLQGLAKTRESAATQLLNSAANKFLKNSQKIFSQIKLDNLLNGDTN
ncbi:MAG: hypothetical protein RMM17_11065 [Acidobacteriota bacterium]|nr:hypothetical protein [Blastocatellia bacterium]MDW8413212.1 hypothetical protein [Acidobacteriota bacterium]